MPYKQVLAQTAHYPSERSVCRDDLKLAEVLASALRSHTAILPSTRPTTIGTILQGNLCEFAVWDIGERHWALYPKKFTFTANAHSPWNSASSDGIDVVALPDQDTLLLVEVKSSDGNGANLITGGDSSLQSDFDGLFQGKHQTRLASSVARLLYDLRYKHERSDLESRVAAMVGDKPATCPNVKLIGALICNAGRPDDVSARQRAFTRLATTLTRAGWRTTSLGFRTVEVEKLGTFLGHVLTLTIT